MPSLPLLRAIGAALLVTAPLASACALPQSGVPASEAAPVGGGAPLHAADKGDSPVAPSGISTTITSLGTVLTSDGFTLYRYSKDSAKPPKSNCLGKCAITWPPVVHDGPIGTNVIDPTMMGSMRRPDGTEQLTINGWPVYRYVRDTEPGLMTGQGIDDAWSAIGIDGKPVPTQATSDPTAGS